MLAYIGLLMILAIAYFVEWVDDKANKKQTENLEHTHKEMYALIDGYCSGREARERKAKVDAMIGALCKDNGKEYKPKNIKQVTTAEERKKLIKAELKGTANDDELIKAQILDALDAGFSMPDEDDEYDETDWYFEEHSADEKREHLIQYYMKSGVSRIEAEESADNFYALVGVM